MLPKCSLTNRCCLDFVFESNSCAWAEALSSPGPDSPHRGSCPHHLPPPVRHLARLNHSALSRCHVLFLLGRLVLFLLPGILFLQLLLFLSSQLRQNLFQGAFSHPTGLGLVLLPCSHSCQGPPAEPWAPHSQRYLVTRPLPVACLVPSCHPKSPAQGLAPSKCSENVGSTAGNWRSHIPADSSSHFLIGRQLPWSERNAKTLPRQTGASLSTDSQHADSRAVRGVRMGPLSLQASLQSGASPS